MEDFYATDCRSFPAGLLYLAASLEQKFPALRVKVLDAFDVRQKKSIPWPGDFEYLKAYYGFPDNSNFKLFHQYYRFGMSVEEIKIVLKTMDPFLIGISSLFSPYYRESLKLARICKAIFPDIPIVMGGNHATMHPESIFYPGKPFTEMENLCDYILAGEAEASICQLVEFQKGKCNIDQVSNLITRENYKAEFELKIPGRDNIPMINIRNLDLDKYQYNGRVTSFLITSRSCPYHCSFCTIHSTFGKKYWQRSISSIFKEIQTGFDHGVRHFDIEDDNFSFNKKRVMELFNGIIQMNLDITFSAMNGICYWLLDDEILAAMKEAGFTGLNLSLVSKDETLCQEYGRPLEIDKFIKVLHEANNLALPVISYLIIGLPGQSVKDIWQTILFLSGLQCLIGASPYYHTPGSFDTGKILPRKLDSQEDPFFLARLTALLVETKEFNRDDIFTFFRLVRVINHIKKGLDSGYNEEHAFFAEAFSVFWEKKWFAKSKRGSQLLPFSRKVANILSESSFMIKGYKSSNKLEMKCNSNE